MKTVTGYKPVRNPKMFEKLGNAIERKSRVALTGLLLILFVDVHALLNTPVLLGKSAAFTDTVHLLHIIPRLVVILESGLGLLFLIHIIYGISLAINTFLHPKEIIFAIRNARGAGFWEQGKTLSSVTKIWTGLFLLSFMVVHVIFLRGNPPEDLYGLIMSQMQNPYIVAGYVVAALCLGFHLFHGVASIVDTLVPWRRKLRLAATFVLAFLAIYPVLVFALIPLKLHFFGGA